jgi:3alpha(or 20beta)-hydroxysteroid dehydrogenase
MERLSGKVALITGGASGIGEGMAKVFAAESCKVVIADIQEEKGRAVARELGSAAHFVRLDVTNEQQWKAAVQETISRFGRLDVLANNAGAASGVQRMDKEDPEDFERILRLNVTGVWYGIRAVIPPMQAQRSGSIVVTASMDSFIGVAGMTTYVTTKFGVMGMTRSAALELGDMGIRINSIHPGIIDTPGVAGLSPRVRSELEAAVTRQPIKRLGRTEEIGRAALFFASDDSSYCTGSSLLIDGGHTAGRYRDLSD